ncbi:uncharacterized protein LOC134536250 [Bacillus rossius redtenbacheri]|uniref:uncharacterized protein LOC134536250 n=1 Tax=Bacillus rossius redtenbacheri TaxID=93214 RepID=UPI002FDE471A
MTYLALLLVAACVLSSGLLHRRVFTEAKAVTNLNELADAFLLSIRTDPSAYSLDPYSINDIEDEFEVESITYELYFKNGTVNGVSNVSRVGDVTTSYNSTTKMDNVSVGLEFSQINYTGNYLVTGPLINDGGGLNVVITSLYAELIFLANLTDTSAVTFIVENITLSTDGTFKVHAENNNAIGEMVNSGMATVMLQLFKSKILAMMESDMVELLNNTLKKMTFSL